MVKAERQRQNSALAISPITHQIATPANLPGASVGSSAPTAPAASALAPSTSAAGATAAAQEPPSPYPGLERPPGAVPRASPTAGPAFDAAAPRTQQGSPATGFPLLPVEVGLGLLALVLLGASFFVRPGKGA